MTGVVTVGLAIAAGGTGIAGSWPGYNRGCGRRRLVQLIFLPDVATVPDIASSYQPPALSGCCWLTQASGPTQGLQVLLPDRGRGRNLPSWLPSSSETCNIFIGTDNIGIWWCQRWFALPSW